MEADDVLQRDEAHRGLAVRQTDEAAQRDRQAQQRRHLLAVTPVAQGKRDRKAEIGNERERMRRIDRQRRHHGEHRFEEVAFEPGLVVLGKTVAADDVDAFPAHERHEPREALLLLVLQMPDLDQHLVELLLRGAAVGAARCDPLAHLAGKAGDADHEELVQIVGRDRQEAHPFQQRMGGVERFLQNAAVELEPGEFAVDEAVGAGLGRKQHRLAGKIALHRFQLVHVASFSSRAQHISPACAGHPLPNP
jgi:hypothetical protein